MDLIVFTQSESFKQYISGIPELKIRFNANWEEPLLDQTCLIHRSSMHEGISEWMQRYVLNKGVNVGVCCDVPEVGDMLGWTQLGAHAYCNSYMRTAHYQQLLRLLNAGQSWFPPELVSQSFELAHRMLHGHDVDSLLSALTEREKQVAIAVSESLSNKQIAQRYNIREPTVKTHLTNIFRKLQINHRVDLVLYLKQR